MPLTKPDQNVEHVMLYSCCCCCCWLLLVSQQRRKGNFPYFFLHSSAGYCCCVACFLSIWFPVCSWRLLRQREEKPSSTQPKNTIHKEIYDFVCWVTFLFLYFLQCYACFLLSVVFAVVDFYAIFSLSLPFASLCALILRCQFATFSVFCVVILCWRKEVEMFSYQNRLKCCRLEYIDEFAQCHMVFLAFLLFYHATSMIHWLWVGAAFNDNSFPLSRPPSCSTAASFSRLITNASVSLNARNVNGIKVRPKLRIKVVFFSIIFSSFSPKPHKWDCICIWFSSKHIFLLAAMYIRLWCGFFCDSI